MLLTAYNTETYLQDVVMAVVIMLLTLQLAHQMVGMSLCCLHYDTDILLTFAHAVAALMSRMYCFYQIIVLCKEGTHCRMHTQAFSKALWLHTDTRPMLTWWGGQTYWHGHWQAS